MIGFFLTKKLLTKHQLVVFQFINFYLLFSFSSLKRLSLLFFFIGVLSNSFLAVGKKSKLDNFVYWAA